MEKTWTCVLLGAIFAITVAIATYAWAVGLPGDSECCKYWWLYDPCSGCERQYVQGVGEVCFEFGIKSWYTCEPGQSYQHCTRISKKCQEGVYDYWWPDEYGNCTYQCSGTPAGQATGSLTIQNTCDIILSDMC